MDNVLRISCSEYFSNNNVPSCSEIVAGTNMKLIYRVDAIHEGNEIWYDLHFRTEEDKMKFMIGN